MDTILMVCNDPTCQIQQKLVRNVLDEVQHTNHKLINLDQLREEVAKINHPIRQVLKMSSSEQLLDEIDARSRKILSIFKNSLDNTVKNIQKQVYSYAQEATDLKQAHDLLFCNNNKQQYKQNDQYKGIYKLNQNYINNYLCQVSRMRLEPFKVLDEFEERVKNILQQQQIVPHEEKKIIVDSKKAQSIKFKNTTKSEAELIKQLLTEQGSGVTELEIDLLGQMINRQELLMPHKVFETITLFKKLQILRLTLSSTTIQDLGDLSKALAGLKQLTSLSLALGNTKVSNVSNLGKALGHLIHLEVLELHFWSSNVSDISEIGKALGWMKNLIQFELQLSNTFVWDVQDIGKGLSENKVIRKFFMNLEFTKVQDISELGWAIYSIKTIEDFELRLIDTLVHPRIRKNFSNGTHFSNEWKQLNKNPASNYKT